MLSAAIAAWTWLRGGSITASAAPYVVVAGVCFVAGYVTAAGRHNNAAELDALRAVIAAHKVADGLRDVATRHEARASQSAYDAERHNATVIAEDAATYRDKKDDETRPVFDGAFLERLRRLK